MPGAERKAQVCPSAAPQSLRCGKFHTLKRKIYAGNRFSLAVVYVSPTRFNHERRPRNPQLLVELASPRIMPAATSPSGAEAMTSNRWEGMMESFATRSTP